MKLMKTQTEKADHEIQKKNNRLIVLIIKINSIESYRKNLLVK